MIMQSCACFTLTCFRNTELWTSGRDGSVRSPSATAASTPWRSFSRSATADVRALPNCTGHWKRGHGQLRSLVYCRCPGAATLISRHVASAHEWRRDHACLHRARLQGRPSESPMSAHGVGARASARSPVPALRLRGRRSKDAASTSALEPSLFRRQGVDLGLTRVRNAESC